MLRQQLCVLAALLLAANISYPEDGKPIKVGIIGLDTSHVVAFTNVLHDPKAKPELAGFRVVAAFPGGSSDVESSRSRVKGFTDTLKDKHLVQIVDSIEELLPKVDVVLLESVDGRPHLEQVKPVLKAGKRVFIDKPVAGTLADAIRIYNLAGQSKTPVFSSSALRFAPQIATVKKNGDLLGCMTYGDCPIEEHHPDLFWYGIHGVEALYALMGTGCESVSRTHTNDTELVVGVWKGGRIGTFRGLRSGQRGYGLVAFGPKKIESQRIDPGYEPLLAEIAKFFRGGPPPVSADETIEMFAFMEAADESKRQGGASIKLADVLAKARAQNAREK